MNQAKESKIAYYWAIYMDGVKQGHHPGKGFDELQVCTHYATHVLHKPYYEVLEGRLRAFKLIKVNEEHSTFPRAMEIFEFIANYSFNLVVDGSGFVVLPSIREEFNEQQKQEVEEKWIQSEIDLGSSIYNWD